MNSFCGGNELFIFLFIVLLIELGKCVERASCSFWKIMWHALGRPLFFRRGLSRTMCVSLVSVINYVHSVNNG